MVSLFAPVFLEEFHNAWADITVLAFDLRQPFNMAVFHCRRLRTRDNWRVMNYSVALSTAQLQESCVRGFMRWVLVSKKRGNPNWGKPEVNTLPYTGVSSFEE